MLRAHLALLINIHQNTSVRRSQTVNVIDETLNIQASADDLEEGKIVVRIMENDVVMYKNIRRMMENMSIPQLHKYQLGLGSATTRTAQQKRMAYRYTKTVIKHSEKHITFVDGSINMKDNPETKPNRKEQKRTMEDAVESW